MNVRVSRALHETIQREERTRLQWQQANAEILASNGILPDDGVPGFGSTFGAAGRHQLGVATTSNNNKPIWRDARSSATTTQDNTGSRELGTGTQELGSPRCSNCTNQSNVTPQPNVQSAANIPPLPLTNSTNTATATTTAAPKNKTTTNRRLSAATVKRQAAVAAARDSAATKSGTVTSRKFAKTLPIVNTTRAPGVNEQAVDITSAESIQKYNDLISQLGLAQLKPSSLPATHAIGVAIQRLEAGKLGVDGGLRINDIITYCNHRVVRSMDDFKSALLNPSIHDNRVHLKIQRGAYKLTFAIKRR